MEASFFKFGERSQYFEDMNEEKGKKRRNQELPLENRKFGWRIGLKKWKVWKLCGEEQVMGNHQDEFRSHCHKFEVNASQRVQV